MPELVMKFATCPNACTPKSVLLAPIRSTFSPVSPFIALSIVSCFASHDNWYRHIQKIIFPQHCGTDYSGVIAHLGRSQLIL